MGAKTPEDFLRMTHRDRPDANMGAVITDRFAAYLDQPPVPTGPNEPWFEVRALKAGLVALEQVNKAAYQAVSLSYLQGLTQEQAAEALGVSGRTVRVRKYEGLGLLSTWTSIDVERIKVVLRGLHEETTT